MSLDVRTTRTITRTALRSVKDRLDLRLNNHLCDMKEGYDDSITGFNEAWDIMRKVFNEYDEARAEDAEP